MSSETEEDEEAFPGYRTLELLIQERLRAQEEQVWNAQEDRRTLEAVLEKERTEKHAALLEIAQMKLDEKDRKIQEQERELQDLKCQLGHKRHCKETHVD
jgi:hypothetical protein